MHVDIEYKTRNLKGAYLYAPEGANHPLPLVIWLTGGNDGAQLPLRFSLGKLFAEGAITPSCAVLCPAASYGHNYTTMTPAELRELVQRARDWCWIDRDNISICGWSLGAGAAAELVRQMPGSFARCCIISNRPVAWDKHPEDITLPVWMIAGGREPSGSRGVWPIADRLPDARMEIAQCYGHEIGEKIWTDPRLDVLGWLVGVAS